MTQQDERPMMEVKRIAIILHEGADLLDIAGPAGVFHCAGRHFVLIGASGRVTYQLDYLSPDGGLCRTRQELPVGSRPLSEADPADYDTVIVVGGLVGDRDCPASLIDWLCRCQGVVRRIGSV